MHGVIVGDDIFTDDVYFVITGYGWAFQWSHFKQPYLQCCKQRCIADGWLAEKEPFDLDLLIPTQLIENG